MPMHPAITTAPVRPTTRDPKKRDSIIPGDPYRKRLDPPVNSDISVSWGEGETGGGACV
jgi:hypothetical protein